MSTTPSPDPLHRLYSDHAAWLRHWLQGKLGNRDEAADIAQDAFVRVLANRKSLQGVSEPRAYLTTIARNLLVDHWRRREIERACLEAIALRDDAEHLSPEARLLIVEHLYRLDTVLHTLPAATRQAFLLSQYDGLTYAQIAKHLRVSEITIKRHMHRAFVACMSLD